MTPFSPLHSCQSQHEVAVNLGLAKTYKKVMSLLLIEIMAKTIQIRYNL